MIGVKFLQRTCDKKPGGRKDTKSREPIPLRTLGWLGITLSM
jgi:hypothetical protein